MDDAPALTTRSGLSITRTKRSIAPTAVMTDKLPVIALPNIETLAKAPAKSRITIIRTPMQRPAPKQLTEMLASTSDPLAIANATRQFELQTLKTRYASSYSEKRIVSTLVVSVQMVPSDPDFPFDLPFLELQITVPLLYPTEHSSVVVNDVTIPVELKQRITDAWMRKCEGERVVLLEMVKWVDRNLEDLLIKKAEMVFVKPGTGEIAERAVEETSVLPLVKEGDDEDELPETTTQLLEKSAHRGIQVRFPNLFTEHIALIVCKVLSLNLRCLHCKYSFDQNVQASPSPQWQSCSQCSTSFGIRYRPTYITTSEPSLGYLDLDGVVAIDLLPSTYIATCECGCEQIPTNSPSSHFKNLVRDWRVEKFCHQCHLKMAFKIDLLKFVKLAPSVLEKTAHLVVKKKRNEPAASGILKDNGTCQHYKKSYRWFRFPCCGKLYACDICHEECKIDGHEMVWATRMVCGFCSKEQNYSKDKDCACGHALTKKSVGGYWEGGKGTRDRTQMARNDPQKHKGLTKTISNKARK